ncbi:MULTISPECIES: hypothetical protein [Leptolyngbya]|uniref:hypothetical protein n=1 Tax=Leptolyngbya TaxID=47251 RepID=UPI00168811AD|nr:hypothetical protein [Leptolyngbya sp. FACHB-1624]MBD1856577.1 hypothetical protein [Leptolyngbya sp. FACHB-1624]
MNPLHSHISAWLQRPEIQQWLQSFPENIRWRVLDNLPSFIENYDPLNFWVEYSVLIKISDEEVQVFGFERSDLKFWLLDSDVQVHRCDYSLHDYLASLPAPTQDDLRKARLLASQGVSREQVYEFLGCQLATEIENAIALGHEQTGSKSDFRKATEDGHLPSIIKLLRRFGWREAG